MSASTVSIKPLRLSQVPALRRLFVQALETDFTYIAPEYRRVISKQNSLLRLAATLRHGNRLVYLAWDGDKLLGYVIGGLGPHHSSSIDWLFVQPGTRGKNIGLKLLCKILQIAAENGASHTTLVTHNYAKYYARQGFKLVDKIETDGLQQDLMRYEF